MLILADFDSFIMPRNGCLKGINAPMVTHKLKDPTYFDRIYLKYKAWE